MSLQSVPKEQSVLGSKVCLRRLLRSNDNKTGRRESLLKRVFSYALFSVTLFFIISQNGLRFEVFAPNYRRIFENFRKNSKAN